jgi:hypothetical protein
MTETGPTPTAALYAERLWPSAGIWFVVAAFGAALGLAPAPVSATAGLVTGVAGLVLFPGLLALSTPRVAVTPGEFTAGRATVPLALVPVVETLNRDQMRKARGVHLDARAYLCLRGWLPAGVRLVLDDPDDPTPYWLVSSRRPDALAAAVASARPPA